MIKKWIDILPALVLHGVLMGLPLLFTTTNEELFEFPKMLLIYTAAALLVFSWAIDTIRTGSFRFPRSILLACVGIFAVSQTLSTIFSLNPHTSWYGYYSRFNGGLLSVYAYSIIFLSVIRTIKVEQVPSYIRSFLIGGICTALYAFPEHFGVSPSCVLITGKLSVDCWVQDVQTRVFGTVGQPNWLAAYLVVLLPVSASYAQRGITQWKEKRQFSLSTLVWPISFLLFCVVLMFTKSRSGILGAAVGLGVFVACLLWEALYTVTAKSKTIYHTLVPGALFCLIFALCVLTISNPVGEKVFSFLPTFSASHNTPALPAPTGTQLESGGSESGDIRKVVWSGAIKVWQRYPFLGSGVETFAYSYFQDRPKEHNLLSEWDFLYNKAHNEFLNYLATTGIIGLFSYLLMYGSFIVLPIIWARRHQTSSEHKNLLYALSASLCGLAVSNFFGFSTVIVSFLTFFLAGIALVLAQQKNTLSLSLPLWGQKGSVRKAGYLASFLLLSYLLIAVLHLYQADSAFALGKRLIGDGQAQEGVQLLQDATLILPAEPVYRDELSYTAARLSYIFGTNDESTKAAQLAQAAIDQSDLVLQQNAINVNFYKTRVRIFTLLAQISPVFYDQAKESLLHAIALSPTDPKLTYNLALISKEQGNMPDYQRFLEETIALRPIDIQALLDLAELFSTQRQNEKAIEVYRRVIQLDPRNDLAHTSIASLSAKQKKNNL